MGLSKLVRRLIPHSVKNFLRHQTLPWKISKLLSPHLPTMVCIDVGASYYPHIRWLTLLNAPATHWLAVEPNEVNLKYLRSWSWPCQVSACTTGLSREGGVQTLYVTNVDSGSSLLPPKIMPSMLHRVHNMEYFFPVSERRIETLTLMQAASGLSATAPVFVKLDTQGTELSILQGAQPWFDERRIVGIEMESTLLAEPVMQGSGKFWQACAYLEQQGFELLVIKPIAAVGYSGRLHAGRNTYLNECDAVFALRQDVADRLSIEHRSSLLAFYLTNALYEEALSLLERDTGVSKALRANGCSVETLLATLQAAV